MYFEALRIIAAALVIFNHTPGYLLYQTTSGASQIAFLVCSLFTRVNVPLFFMISGALLLRKTENYEVVLKKRAFRIILLVVLFEAAMFYMRAIQAFFVGKEVHSNVLEFLLGVVTGTVNGVESYWYLYAYLGILMILPFLQRAVKEMTEKECCVLIGLHFLIWSLVPLANTIFFASLKDGIRISENFSVPLATIKSYFFFIIGYYIDAKNDILQIRKKDIAVLLSAAALGILISSICTLEEGIRTGNFTQNYMQMFDYLSAIAVFILIKRAFLLKSISDKYYHILCFTGSLTLGVYLLDPFLQRMLYPLYSSYMTNSVSTFALSIGWVVISMLLGGVITMVLKKFPLLGKLI